MCSANPDLKKTIDAADKPTIENEYTNCKLDEWRESTKAILGLPAHSKPFSISNVAQELLEGNYKNAYMPKTISIGPRHKGTRKNLLEMENTKWKCMQSLLHRGPKKKAETTLEQCKEVILGLENVIRASYADEDLQLEWNDLANILLCDACFLLELLISRSKELNDKYSRSRSVHPGPGTKAVVVEMKEEELADLLVLENQIPLVILHRLCERIFDEVGVVAVVPVETLVLNLFGYYPHKRFKYFTPNIASHHFLELVHSYVSEDSEEMEKVLKETHQRTRSDQPHVEKLPKEAPSGVQQHVCIDMDKIECPNFQNVLSGCGECASNLTACCGELPAANPDMPDGKMLKAKVPNAIQTTANPCVRILEAAGVKIVITGTENKHMDDVGKKLKIRGLNFNIIFDKRNGRLEIPQLHITETTEVIWRNLIAWEQGHAGFSCNHRCTWAAFFFNDLICRESDVQLLKDRRVIVVDNHFGMTNRELMKFLRSMIRGIDPEKISHSPYWKMVSSDLNSYTRSCCFKLKQYPVIWLHSWLPKAFRQTDKFVLRGYNFVIGMIAVYTLLGTVYTILGFANDREDS